MTSSILHFLSNHGFMVLPLTILLTVFSFLLLRKKFPKGIFVVFLFPVFGIVNLINGGEWNASYVYKNGVKGEAVIVSIVPTNNYINHVQVVEYNCLIKLSNGKQVKAMFENNGSVFYPQNSSFLVPVVGKVFTVKYMEGDEANFIIPTDVSNPEYNCLELMQKISEAQAAFQLDKTNAKNKSIYKSRVQEFMKAPCDTNLKRAFQLQLNQMNK